jgi:predicted metal-dependent enzyme (double-stranded beta helix superfamily)
MFDVDDFVARCRDAAAESGSRAAIRDVLLRACSDPEALADALPPTRAGIERLHVSSDLSVLQVVWAPGMTLGPHDHRMWATIGVYSGGEDNRFYRRAGTSLVESGGRSLRPGDVCLLGADAVHAVTNPTTEFAGAIHVYGGDFFTRPRSEWRGDPLTEEPHDVDRLLATFAEANRAAAAG